MKKVTKKEYSISTIKGLIGAVPAVGTFFNEIIFEARSRIKQDRINSFIEELAEYMDDVSESELDLASLDAGDFGDILEEIIISVSKTSAKHKTDIFKRILKNELGFEKKKNDEILRYIAITNSLGSIQFKILSTYSNLSDRVLKYPIQILELKKDLTSNEEILKKKRQ